MWQASEEHVFTIEFWGEEVSQITYRNHLTGEIYEYLQIVEIYPAKHTVTTQATIDAIIPKIQADLDERLAYFSEM